MPTAYETLVPRTMAREVIADLPKESATLRLGRRLTMPSGQTTIPVVSFMPAAAFVTPRYGGRKPATKIEWTAQNVQAEELACTLAIPERLHRRRRIPRLGAGTAPGHDRDRRDARRRRVFRHRRAGRVPGRRSRRAGRRRPVGRRRTRRDRQGRRRRSRPSGVTPNGIVAGPAIGTALRAAYREAGALPGEAPAQVLYGWQVGQMIDWDSTKGDAMIGDFNYLLVGRRRGHYVRALERGDLAGRRRRDHRQRVPGKPHGDEVLDARRDRRRAAD